MNQFLAARELELSVNMHCVKAELSNNYSFYAIIKNSIKIGLVITWALFEYDQFKIKRIKLQQMKRLERLIKMWISARHGPEGHKGGHH